MIESIFGKEENTIEVCSGNIRKHSCMTCFTVDTNPETKPDLVADGQILSSIPNKRLIVADTIHLITLKLQKRCTVLVYPHPLNCLKQVPGYAKLGP